MNRNHHDLWIGIVMLVAAVIYGIEANKIRISPLDGPVGASGLPKILAVGLGVLALILIIQNIKPRGGVKQAVKTNKEPVMHMLRPHLRAVGMLFIGIGYLLLLPWLGYLLAISVLLLTVSLYIGARFQIHTLLVAAAGGLVCHVLFAKILAIPFPTGVWLTTLLGAC